MTCYVFGCHSTGYKKKKGKNSVSYHRFPVDFPDLCQKWVDFCKRDKDRAFNFDAGRICSRHFTDNDYERNLMYEMGFSSVARKLKPGSVPTIFKVKKKKKPKSDQAAEFIAPDEVINSNIDELIKWDPTECCEVHRSIAARENKLCKKNSQANDSSHGDIPCCTAKARTVKQEEQSQEENDPLQLVQDDNLLNCITCSTDPTIKAAKESLLEQVKQLQNTNRFLKLNQTDKVKLVFVTPTQDYTKQIKTLQRENSLLQTTLIKLQERLTKCTLQNNNLETQLLKVFSKAQLHQLRKGGTKIHWSRADILKALKLFKASKKVYHMLLEDKLPLPSIRTLQRWQKMDKDTAKLMEEIQEDDCEMGDCLNFDDIIYEDDGNDEDMDDQTIPVETVINEHSYVVLEDASALFE